MFSQASVGPNRRAVGVGGEVVNTKGPGHNTPFPPPPPDLDMVPGHMTPSSPQRDFAEAGSTHPTGMHYFLTCTLFNNLQT